MALSLSFFVLAVAWALGASAQTPTPTPCSTCILIKLQPPVLDAMKYRFNNETCKKMQELMAMQLNEEYAASGRMPMIQPFTVDPAQCQELQVGVCGTFPSAADAQSLAEFADYQASYWLEVLSHGGSCTAPLDGYRLYVTSSTNACLYVEKFLSCAPAINPFPNCRCNRTKMITPFKPSAYGYTDTGRSNTTTLYCFIVNLLGPDERIPGGCANETILYKVEFWADDTFKAKVKGFKIIPNLGTAKWLSATWGSKGDNNVRATPLKWTFKDANGGKVCMELDNSISLSDLCIGPGANQCYLSFFNSDLGCCPTYRAEVLI